jgi:hypothetical protein
VGREGRAGTDGSVALYSETYVRLYIHGANTNSEEPCLGFRVHEAVRDCNLRKVLRAGRMCRRGGYLGRIVRVEAERRKRKITLPSPRLTTARLTSGIVSPFPQSPSPRLPINEKPPPPSWRVTAARIVVICQPRPLATRRGRTHNARLDALLNVGFQHAKCGFMPLQRHLQGSQQPLGSVVIDHNSL